MLDLDQGAFDRRLDPALGAQPIGVAVSGGGDSLAALILTKAWADRCGRPVVALHVDHRLQALSAAWADVVAAAAARLGVAFRGMAWTGPKPERGLAAAARRARHALIAEAARAAGATSVVFGHTADDLAEAALMRAEGSSLGQPREWAPSPVWPEGRGVFILRPLLAARRATIRAALSTAGWSWVDDPANVDAAQPRARARLRLAGAPLGPACAPADETAAARLAARAVLGDDGVIRLRRDALRAAPAATASRVLGAAMLAAGGGERPPRRDRVTALVARASSPVNFVATLAGARLTAGDDLEVARDAGEAARGGLASVSLLAGEPAVWDGRFELCADRSGLDVVALAGRQRALPASARRALARVPAPARPTLPALATTGGDAACPILAGESGVIAKCLVGVRFLSACGAVWKEPAA